MSLISKLRSPLTWWRSRWRVLPPQKQDRLAALGPLVSVFLFLVTIAAALTYFTLDERKREKEAVMRDVEYSQQRLRLRLLERQEQLLRMARDINIGDLQETEFHFQVETLITQYPELLAVTWVNAMREVVSGHATPSAPAHMVRPAGTHLSASSTGGTFELARDLRQVAYSRPVRQPDGSHTFMLATPLSMEGRFNGVLLAEYSIEALLIFGVPSEVLSRYAVTFIDEQGQLLAGTPHASKTAGVRPLPWATPLPPSHVMPVAPIGHHLRLHAQGYQTNPDTLGEAFFWVVGAISALTLWMLLANMGHNRRRLQAQRALVAETNFRRAMENSMLTGMRALDLRGRIAYVNPAFCSMTGWTEQELLGAQAPFPYWPESEHEALLARLEEEINGRSQPSGFEMPVKRKNGSIFHARMYVSPLVDPQGQQTGWMTSMTDITEPKRIREELSASYQRFTTVLDSLDEAISVTPLNSAELLFANKMYQTWFGAGGQGHRLLVESSSVQPTPDDTEADDLVDGLAGLPTDAIIQAQADNAHIFIASLNKWLEVRTRYLTWVDGRLAQMVIATDITARRLAQEQAALQAERAETASRLITMGEMASSVAHELNQPLTAISNYSSGLIDRLKKQQLSPDDMLTALEKTAKQAQRAGQIIQRIRAFVKRSEPTPTLSDVNHMVSNATELAEIDLRRHLIRLSVYVAARLPRLMVDPILIEQVLINLIKNGGEAILQAQQPIGRRHIEVTVTPAHVDGQDAVEFRVSDTGQGVPMEQLERIYEAFYSTKAEGMGIGLKLCRSIVESHRGRLQARNLYNANEITGCEFSFWIPVPPAEQA